MATAPFARYGPAIVYDQADHYMLLSSTSFQNTSWPSTWAYEAGNWSRMFPSQTPTDTFAGNVVYDVSDGYVVDQEQNANETWEFHTGSWSQLRPTDSPGPLFAPAMAYDPEVNSVVLFGGARNSLFGSYSVPTNVTWAFHGGNWTALSPASAPSPRLEAEMAYDQADGYLVLWGGLSNLTGSGTWLNETWTYAHGVWSRLSLASAPPVCSQAFLSGMTYDSADKEIVLVDTCQATPETWWSFQNGVWTSHGSLPFAGGNVQSGTDDPAGGRAFYIGCSTKQFVSWEGCDDGQGSPYPLATFGLLAGSWTNISIPASPGNPGYLGAMAFDEAAGFLIGVTWSPRSGPCGSVGLTTWKFQDEVWSVLPTVHAPQARFSESMAYDPALGVVVLFGGVTWCGAVTNETWAFNGTDWANVTSMSGGGLPPPLQGASMAYDGRDAAMILFGGISGWSCPTCRPSNATWQLVDWNWSQVNTSGAAVPPARCDGSMVYDSSSDEIVLMGASSYGCYPDLEDMWAYSGGVWTNETPTAGFPLGAYAPRLADDPALGSVIAFVGWGGTDCSTPGYCSETWSFRDDSWTDLGPLFPVAPDPREFAVMAYDVADATVVLQGGISNLGVEGGADMWDTWILSVAGLPGPPVIGAFVADSPASEVGKTVHFSLLTSGGDGTLNFDYTGIPPGCASTNTPLLVCYLTTSGTFNVTAIATDVLGRSARANMELRVAAHLQIDRFQAVPSSISLGGSSTLSASISGGLAPTIVSYLSLPPGCASANTTDLSCTPDASGAFQISLLVQDSIGIFAFASTFLNVTSVPLPTPLSIESFVVEPAVVSVNQSVQFTVAIWGGTAPATPSYSGLPPGCLNSQAMTFTCHPKVPGVYLVKLAVSDAAGTNASASTLLTVLAPVQPLTILAFVASPNPWSDGQTVLFQAITSGGTLPLSYFYGGLPEGCVGVDTARLTCSPVCPHASTNVTIAVVDATGAKATSSLTLFWASAAATENGSGPSFPAFAPIYWVVGAGFGAAIGAGIALAVVRKKADSDK